MAMKAPEQCQEIARHCKRRWYKAIQVKPDLDVVAEIKNIRQLVPVLYCSMRGILKLKGGTGHQFDWSKFPET